MRVLFTTRVLANTLEIAAGTAAPVAAWNF